MPRNPVRGFVSGVWGLVWGALGLLLAAWTAMAALDVAKGFDLVVWGVGNLPFGVPWEPVEAAAWAANNLVPFGIAAGFALLLGGSNLRAARIAFRPATQSQDGKGELQLSSREDVRVGKPLEGSILLRDAPAPGDEFELVLSGGRPGHAGAYRVEQKVRARQGAHGVNLPFRFEVPASAAPSAPGSPWRLEFARADKPAFVRSAFDVRLAPAPAHEVRNASAPAPGPEASPAVASAPAAQGYAEQIERLYGAFGGKLSQAQRDQLRARLSTPEAAGMARQFDGLNKISPQHLKLVKYAVIGLFVLFFVFPFVVSVLGLVLAAIFGS